MGIGGIAGGFPWMPGQVERNNQKSFAYRSVYETVSVYLNGKIGEGCNFAAALLFVKRHMYGLFIYKPAASRFHRNFEKIHKMS